MIPVLAKTNIPDRSQFEEWVVTFHGLSVKRDKQDDYVNNTVNAFWHALQEAVSKGIIPGLTIKSEKNNEEKLS